MNPKTAASGRVHPNLIYMTRSLKCNGIDLENFSSAGLRAARESGILRRQHRSGGSSLRSETVGQTNQIGRTQIFSLFEEGFHNNEVCCRRGFLVDRVRGPSALRPKAWGKTSGDELRNQSLSKCHLKQHDIMCPQPSPTTGLRSVLELRDLRLTVITPLVRTNVNGIKVELFFIGSQAFIFDDRSGTVWP